MLFELRVDGHPFQYLQTFLEATSSERDGEPSQFQARLVKIFLVVFLLTVPGALSFLLLSAEESPQQHTALRQSLDRHGRSPRCPVAHIRHRARGTRYAADEGQA